VVSETPHDGHTSRTTDLGGQMEGRKCEFRGSCRSVTQRNLYALTLLRSACDVTHSSTQTHPLFFFTWILHKCSNLMGYNRDGVGRVDKGTYYVPPIRLEVRPTKYLSEAKRSILAHYEYKSKLNANLGECCISSEPNSQALRRLPESSIDYIFTDPPYLNVEVHYVRGRDK
jgi:hypothetical protein